MAPLVAHDPLHTTYCTLVVAHQLVYKYAGGMTTRLWNHRPYLIWLVSDTTKDLGAGLASFALPLIALMATGEPAQAGVIAAVGAIATLVLALYGGLLADRHSRIRLMVLCSTLAVAIALALLALTLTDSLGFATLLGLELLFSVQFGLFGVAGEAALKDLVPSDAVGRAQAANQARDAVLRLGANPLAGMLLAVGGWLLAATMLIAGLVSTASAVLLGRSSGSTEHAAPTLRDTSLREGLSWLARRRDLRSVLLLMTIVNLGFNAATTTLIYSMQQDGQPLPMIGLLGTSIGAASLVGAVLATRLVTLVPSGTLVITSLALGTIALAVLPFTRSVPVSIVAPALGLLMAPCLNAALLGYSMVATPTELVGRVRSASMIVVSAAMPLAPMLAGFGLSSIGREATLWVCVALCTVATLIALLNRALHSLPIESEWAAHAEQFADTASP